MTSRALLIEWTNETKKNRKSGAHGRCFQGMFQPWGAVARVNRAVPAGRRPAPRLVPVHATPARGGEPACSDCERDYVRSFLSKTSLIKLTSLLGNVPSPRFTSRCTRVNLNPGSFARQGIDEASKARLQYPKRSIVYLPRQVTGSLARENMTTKRSSIPVGCLLDIPRIPRQ